MKSLKSVLPFGWMILLFQTAFIHSQDVLVEAESFAEHGGWKLDTQFIDNMGSPYLLAHGLGKPVTDATTTVSFEETGAYHVFVRTKDWVAIWNAKGKPGRFQLEIDGTTLATEFGTENRSWYWQYGGEIGINKPEVSLTLKDLTGFDGRCDAIYFSKTKTAPSNSSEVLPAWRRKLLSLPAKAPVIDGYDLVVVGGGYSGIAAALSGARCGCKVALIQNRGVLGGNGSSEVRVWSQGLVRRGKYPRIGEIVEEFCDRAKKSPGTYEEFGDQKKEALVLAESNIDLFLHHHAFDVKTSDNRIQSVAALDTRTGEVKYFAGRQFCDCTGHGTIGYLAGADFEITPNGRMGMSNMWAWDEGVDDVAFPKTPWALDLDMKDFPYPRDHHGQWFWESGFDKDPIGEAEAIRDWNLRAVYGAFNAMKNRDGAEQHKTAFLTWVAYVGGPRESRRLMGDVVLNQDDIVNKKEFADGCVPSTWSIDLHYPKKQFAKKFPDNPFISIAVHDRRIDRNFGYPVPYRCFYSRNIENLFMAGRCISVTHQALGTTRVMKTCGMMGEVVGKAASVCQARNCMPRDVYQKYWSDMEALLQLPGKAFRISVDDTFTIPNTSMPLAPSGRSNKGIDARTLTGIVVDNGAAHFKGNWTSSTNLPGFVGNDYVYAAEDSGASASFSAKVKSAGRYELRIAYQPYSNRGTKVPITVATGGLEREYRVDMTKPGDAVKGFQSIGQFKLEKNQECSVTIGSQDAGGTVHVDAVQLIRIKK